MRIPENLLAEGEDRETLAEIRDLKLAPINMKLLLWPRNGLPRATLHYRNWNWIFRMGNSWDILICCSPQTIDHHSLSLWIPPHRSLLLVAFPIVKLTNLWRKHVAIPVGSYCTSVYFDGHHSQSLIRMSPRPVPGTCTPGISGIWYLASLGRIRVSGNRGIICGIIKIKIMQTFNCATKVVATNPRPRRRDLLGRIIKTRQLQGCWPFRDAQIPP